MLKGHGNEMVFIFLNGYWLRVGPSYTKSETLVKDTQPLHYADGVNVSNEKSRRENR
jgi:hypothetical protein